MLNIKCAYSDIIETHKLIPHPRNPNRHPVEQIDRLAKIIDFQGWRHPIIVSRLSGFVVAGHARLEAANQLALHQVPVDYQDFESEAQEYAFLVSDNAIAEFYSETDLAAVNLELGDLGPDFDIDLLGIKDFCLDASEKLEPGCEPDDTPQIPVEAKSKLGDLWTLGRHRLLCGDATDIVAVDRLMDGAKADMVLTDPPYNIASDSRNYAANTSKAMADLKESEWDKNFDIGPALSCISTVCADSVTIYVWTSQFLIQKIWDHLTEWCDFTSYCVWNKPNPMPSLSKRHWTWNTELCVYGTRGSKRVVNFPKSGHATSVWTFNKKSDGSHPTQKPIELCEHPILFSSAPEQKVLDLFGGSGSTLIACEKTNRICFMMELDPKYIDVILSRWTKYTGKDPVRDDGMKWSELNG